MFLITMVNMMGVLSRTYNFTSLFTSWLGLLEKELHTNRPMSLAWASHIALLQKDGASISVYHNLSTQAWYWTKLPCLLIILITCTTSFHVVLVSSVKLEIFWTRRVCFYYIIAWRPHILIMVTLYILLVAYHWKFKLVVGFAELCLSYHTS